MSILFYKVRDEQEGKLGGGVIFTKQETAIQLQSAVTHAFSEVRAEMDDHLDAINQNALETQGQSAQLRELDAKVDKLAQRIDDLFMLIAPEKSMDFSTLQLSRQEQEVFLLLYNLEGPLTPEQTGVKLGLSKQLAAQYLYNLQVKGIPMIARNWKGELFYSLDLKFKDLQSRNNVIKISQAVIAHVSSVL